MKNKNTIQSKEFRIIIQVSAQASICDRPSQNNNAAPADEIVICIGDGDVSGHCKIVITCNKAKVILQKNPADTAISNKSPKQIQARTPQVRLPVVRMAHVQAAPRRRRTLSARQTHASHHRLRLPRRIIHMRRNRSPVLKPRSDPVSDLFAKQHPNAAENDYICIHNTKQPTMKRFINRSAVAAAIAIAAAACSRGPQWSLEGTLEGADGDGEAIVLEAANSDGFWYTVDSITTDSKGRFSTSQPAPAVPDIFRLNYSGRYIYFPVDSVDRLTITAKAGDFDRDFTLTGTPDADMVSHVDHRINDFLKSHRTEDLDTAVTLKRELGGMVLQNPSGIVSYYIVQKQVKGRPLFRIDNRRELGVIGAVANAFSENRPDDPRTGFLKNMWLSNMPRAISGDTIMAQEIDLIEIAALDNKGTRRSLQDAARSNRVVLLNFTNYNDSYSQPLNIALRKVWDKYHAQGLEVFQLGFDANEFNWRVSADNQPWITVFNGTTDTNLRNYNVGQLPALFVISGGQLTERITDPQKIEATVARHF